MEQILNKDCIKDMGLPLKVREHWIGGRWQNIAEHSEEKTSENPNNGEVIATFHAGKAIGKVAIDAAYRWTQEFSPISFDERIKHLTDLANSIADQHRFFCESLQLEAGKPRWEAEREVSASIGFLRQFGNLSADVQDALLAPARLSDPQGTYRLHSLGICLAYLPFANPLFSFVNYFCACSLAGSPLVLFSSSHAILCAAKIASLNLDLAPGRLNVVFGGFEEFKSCLSDHRVESVIYTGSKEHCDLLTADASKIRDRRLILQSGGKNAVLVHSTADIEKAVDAIAYGAFKSSGQLCSSTNRVFVYRSLIEEFKKRLIAKTHELKIGRTDLFDEKSDPTMGPLYCQKAVDKFLRFQTMAQREASEIWCYGRAIESDSPKKGAFVSPGIHYFDQLNPQSAYQRNVILGPDIAVYPYDILNEAIAKVNETDSCLAVAFFGEESILSERSHMFRAPNLILNGPTVETDRPFPLASRSINAKHLYNGVALALNLSYPQCIITGSSQQSWSKDD